MKSVQSDLNSGVDPAGFFDALGKNYGTRYHGQDPFHRYFFGERLSKAIAGLDFDGKQVLDIGSGTGALYTALIQGFPTMHFLASDVSAGMLEHSSVPASNRLLGHIYDHDLGGRRFHFIFMLGVTTYMEPAELDRNLQFAVQHLTPDGKLIISFTNKHSLDSFNRRVARQIAKPNAKHVLTSGVRVHTYTYKQAQAKLAPAFLIEKLDLLNHTVFPFNRWFPKASLRLAKRLAANPGHPAWLNWLSSDFLLRAERTTHR